MPYQSEKQRRFMYAKHPDIAKKWEHEGSNVISPGRKEAIKRRMMKKHAPT